MSDDCADMCRPPCIAPPPLCRWERNRETGEHVAKVEMPKDPWLVSIATEGAGIVDYVNGLRRTEILEHEALAAEQKACGKAGNVDAARWYRGLAAASLKRLRAVRLWLGHFDPDASGDAPWVEAWYWPADLAPEIHDVASAIGLWCCGQ